jgi:hypothetical protein
MIWALSYSFDLLPFHVHPKVTDEASYRFKRTL